MAEINNEEILHTEPNIAMTCTEAVLHKLTTLIQIYENEDIKELQTLVNLHLATSTQLQAIQNGEIIEPTLVRDWDLTFNETDE